MKENCPQASDSLFVEEVDPRVGAWLQNPADKFFLYSEGYKKTGRDLLDICLTNSFFNNILVYPMVFNFRHFVELRLKELLILGHKYIGCDDDYLDTHSLVDLWKKYRNELLPQIESELDTEILNNVERIIVEFDNEDSGFNYRYPESRKNKQGKRFKSLNRNTLDLMNFKSVIEKLILFLDWQWDMISHYQDLHDDMVAAAYQDYY